ncbi:type II toxin-antitoxin system VapC family toxin [Gemmatimonas sp.]|uniref:type II toxin-antitoxin system VapC family toxin n=1 Tax=Gemmatimonas sp. TaxID=1962908 RepID=UPI00286C79D6|nr:type II toxin-antitoxin system VapC family toxin [Gemmatimonas sp.]
MRVLLDTHVLIWWDSGARLSPAAMKAIRSADEVLVSSASAWEIAIKTALGKISGTRTIAAAVEASAFTELPVLFRHAEAAARLPSHHRDPFDRMLIAQAQVEGLVVISRDQSFARYDLTLIPA